MITVDYGGGVRAIHKGRPQNFDPPCPQLVFEFADPPPPHGRVRIYEEKKFSTNTHHYINQSINEEVIVCSYSTLSLSTIHTMDQKMIFRAPTIYNYGDPTYDSDDNFKMNSSSYSSSSSSSYSSSSSSSRDLWIGNRV